MADLLAGHKNTLTPSIAHLISFLRISWETLQFRSADNFLCLLLLYLLDMHDYRVTRKWSSHTRLLIQNRLQLALVSEWVTV